jgi:type II secretory pathway pseudopilin PulG
MKRILLMGVLLVVAAPVFAAEPPKATCEEQLAETMWSYQQLGKDRQDKERQRDHAEVRAFLLERQVQQLQKQVHDLQEAATQALPEKKE